MNLVTLKSDGTIFRRDSILEADPLSLLNCQVELDKKFTLRSYFLMLENYPLLSRLNPFFPTIMEQYHTCPESNCIWDGINSLEFSKAVEMIGFPKKRLEIYNTFLGVCGKKRFEIKSMQLEHLLDITVTLGKVRHIIFGDQIDLFEFDTVFTLFEFIEGILWELSFHANPKQCDIRR
jgi:hypothetical protein